MPDQKCGQWSTDNDTQFQMCNIFDKCLTLEHNSNDRPRIENLQYIRQLPDSVNAFNESGTRIGFVKSLRTWDEFVIKSHFIFSQQQCEGPLHFLVALGISLFEYLSGGEESFWVSVSAKSDQGQNSGLLLTKIVETVDGVV
jgi:hypothetical protein